MGLRDKTIHQSKTCTLDEANRARAAGYPICPYIEDHKKYIENVVGLPVKVGTHPMPANYIKVHAKAGDWKRDSAEKWLKDITGNQEDADKYDSTNPNFLKK